VQDFRDLQSARVPWLEQTGFLSHLVGLKDKEIRNSYQLPRKVEEVGDEEAVNHDLARILRVAEASVVNSIPVIPYMTVIPYRIRYGILFARILNTVYGMGFLNTAIFYPVIRLYYTVLRQPN
jgi:hypothetical protein